MNIAIQENDVIKCALHILDVQLQAKDIMSTRFNATLHSAYLASFLEHVVDKFSKQFRDAVVLVYEILKCLQMPIRDDV